MSLAVSTAEGKDCKGIYFPDHQVGLHGTNLTLNGIGLQKATFLRVDVYVAALYVTVPSQDSDSLINTDAPQELIVHFLRNVSVDDVRKEWTRDFTHAAPGTPESLMRRVATLNTWLADVRRGERLTFIRQPGEGILVRVDGIDKGTIPGDDFSRTFMSIWVGAAPPSHDLKRGLLGGRCD